MCTGCSSDREQSRSGTSSERAPDSAEEPCQADCTQRTIGPREVSERISQTISNAPTGQEAWNGTYAWRSKFTLVVNRSECTVRVGVKLKVRGTITGDQTAQWRSSIEGAWNNRAKLICTDPSCPQACTNGYRMVVAVQYVTSGEHHYRIRAQNPGADSGGRAGLGGTTSMTRWGVNDTVDIVHEFGHMLGNCDEYHTTNGVDYTYGGTVQGFRDPEGGVMNNPANPPNANNFDFIARQVQELIGGAVLALPD